MKWLFAKNDFSDKDMDTFLAGLRIHVLSSHRKASIDKYLTEDYVLTRIKTHLITCVTSLELSEDATITRVWRCIESLRIIFRTASASPTTIKAFLPPIPPRSLKYPERIHIRDVRRSQQVPRPRQEEPNGVPASIVHRAVAIQDLLSHSPLKKTDDTQSPVQCVSYPPLHVSFPEDNKNVIQHLTMVTK